VDCVDAGPRRRSARPPGSFETVISTPIGVLIEAVRSVPSITTVATSNTACIPAAWIEPGRFVDLVSMADLMEMSFLCQKPSTSTT
jgi:hypothetical protein